MKVIILCGGRGTRLGKETEIRPKSLMEIGGKPILWHIMKIYAQYGFNDFILCLGYKGEMIKDYFLNYAAMSNDFTISLKDTGNIRFHTNRQEEKWNITFADTGLNAQTGTRIKRVEKYIKEDLFMVTYGDGVCNINIEKLVKFHRSQKTIGTVSGVHPSSRFGELVIKENTVTEFSEKRQTKQGFINGGFFVFKKKFFDYLSDRDDCYLEREPLEKLAKDKQLSVYLHKEFWQCMDTQRELDILNKLWESKNPPWKIWR